jgi:hypothetical protein
MLEIFIVAKSRLLQSRCTWLSLSHSLTRSLRDFDRKDMARAGDEEEEEEVKEFFSGLSMFNFCRNLL